MLTIEIPGTEPLKLEHLVLDYNGTIAFDGILKESVLARLERLAESLTIHILTADTHGTVHAQCSQPYMHVHVIGPSNQDHEKLNYLNSLDAATCVAIGNGRNDTLMLKEAALGIAVMQEEGLCIRDLYSTDILFKSIDDALDALKHPGRLVATLRN